MPEKRFATPTIRLVVVNNSIYNRDFQGIAVRNHADLDVIMVNNLFGGAPVGTIEGEGQLLGNLTRPEHGMTDPRNYDFSLTSGAAAIDRGIQFETDAEIRVRAPDARSAAPGGLAYRCGRLRALRSLGLSERVVQVGEERSDGS